MAGLLRVCSHPECSTLTMGELCLEHEAPVVKTFARGRPFRRVLPRPRLRPVIAAPVRQLAP